MSFGWVSEGLAEQLKIQHMEFSPTVLWTTIPKWMLQETNVDLNMWNIKERNKTADLVQELHRNYVEEKYGEYIYIYIYIYRWVQRAGNRSNSSSNGGSQL